MHTAPFPVGVLLLSLTLGAHAQFAPGPVGEIIRYGLCEHGRHLKYSQPDSAAGYAEVGEMTLTTPTDVVPLRRGIGFGIEWKASGLPKSRELVFSYRISHPRIVRPDGRVLTLTTEELPMEVVNGEIRTTDCYFLSEQHEVVAGEWEIAVWFEGKPLVSKRFKVGVASFTGWSIHQPIQVLNTNQGYELQLPLGNVLMIIPKDGFVQKYIKTSGSKGTAIDNPRYFFFENTKNGIVLSGWFEPAAQYTDFKKNWETRKNNFIQQRLPAPQNETYTKIGNWDTILYESTIPNQLKFSPISNANVSNIVANVVQSDTWIELHISITSELPPADARAKLLEVLKTIIIKEKSKSRGFEPLR